MEKAYIKAKQTFANKNYANFEKYVWKSHAFVVT